MKPLQIYGPRPQAKTALDVLSMLMDKKKRKEVMVALEAVETEREKLNEAIAVYGKAEKIGSLLRSATEKDSAAKRLLDDANTEAAEIRAKAKKDTDAARERAKVREDAVATQKKEFDAREAELTSALDTREAGLVKREEEAAVKEARLESQTLALGSREKAYRDRRKALEALPPL